MIAIIARDSEDLTGRHRRLLDDCLKEATLTDDQVTILTLCHTPTYGFFGKNRGTIEGDIAELKGKLFRLKPKVMVALGNEVSHVLTSGWPDKRSGSKLVHSGNIFGARDIENRRGYAFDSPLGPPVIVTVRPSDASVSWVPWRMLLSFDLQRAKELHDEHLCRPRREIEIVTSPRSARDAVVELGRYSRLASDIETWRDTSLACIGFAGESGRGIVFPAQYLDYARELLRTPEIETVWANGTYDLFCLKHREGVEVLGPIGDVMCAWHSAYPELAGKKEDKKKHKMTRKSLAFLASLCTWDHYWKGDYETDEEFFIYNGKDCCITFDVDTWVQGVVDDLGARETYDHEMGLVWPVVDMLQRGLGVDENLRVAREVALTLGFSEEDEKLGELALPLLERARRRRLRAPHASLRLRNLALGTVAVPRRLSPLRSRIRQFASANDRDCRGHGFFGRGRA